MSDNQHSPEAAKMANDIARYRGQPHVGSTNGSPDSDAIVRRFLFRFLFHPATDWSKPYPREEVFEGRDEAEARRNFETTWYRNTSEETCKELTSLNIGSQTQPPSTKQL